MTYTEVLQQYSIVAVRVPKKGELILTAKNSGGTFGVNRVSASFKKLPARILERKDNG